VPDYQQIGFQPIEKGVDIFDGTTRRPYQESDPTRNWTLPIPAPNFVTDEAVRPARAEMRRTNKKSTTPSGWRGGRKAP